MCVVYGSQNEFGLAEKRTDRKPDSGTHRWTDKQTHKETLTDRGGKKQRKQESRETKQRNQEGKFGSTEERKKKIERKNEKH